MKHLILTSVKKRSLHLAIAMAFGLTACGGEQWGDTNDGQANTGTGIIGDGAATSLLLLGGIVGLGAILSDSDDDAGVIVTTEGGATGNNGTDGTGTGNNGTDGSGTDNNGTDGTGTGNNGTDGTGTGNNGTDGTGTGNNGTDGTGTGNNGTDGTGTGNNGTDGTGTGNNGTDGTDGSNISDDATLVDSLEAPDWLLGMWRGSDSDGITHVGFAAPQEMGVSVLNMPMTSYADIPEVCLHLIQSNSNVFEYTVWYPGPDKNGVFFSEQWINNGDGTVLYTVSGAMENQFTMYSSTASSLLAPPSWLQGRWASASVNGSAIQIADINEGNINLGIQGGSRTDYYQLANQDHSAIRIVKNDGTTYSFELTTVSEDHTTQTVVTETFRKTGANTIISSGSGTHITMTRQ